MIKKLFTDKEIELLSKNPNVKSVSAKVITYADNFKQHCIAENLNGKPIRMIFEECGFDVEVIGIDRIKSAGKRWRSYYREDGIDGLKDTRKGNSGRPLGGELSLEEKHARLEIQVNLLKAENELLKKIDLAERRLKEKK